MEQKRFIEDILDIDPFINSLYIQTTIRLIKAFKSYRPPSGTLIYG